MSKNRYKYTCQYCDYQWELSYGVKKNTCIKCKDKNVKLEEIKILDYYGTDEKKREKDEDPFSDWRD